MSAYILRRLAQMAPLIVGISIVVFALIQAAPGGPEAALLSSGRFVDPSVVEAYRVKLGVDQPVPVQYLRWAMTVLTGDLGVSYATMRPVTEMIAERLPATLELTASAFLVAAILAAILGLASALRPHSWTDLLSTGGSFVGIAMPVFWLGLILQLVLGVELGWLPVSGTHTVGASTLGDHLAHLILPALVLASRYVASWSQYFRSSLIGVLESDYIRMARAQGLSESRVLFVHTLPNAMAPMISVMALGLADLASGAVITETVFAWPGIGRLFVQAMFARDYPVLMGVLLMGAVTVIAFNLVADVLYGVLDPRIRYE
ncbi:MAG: ABC transporter permease [Vicinamibacteria bacterium]|nr:ABC transporter permease [Vicinamibacteria bacterium]